jgi:hypothetical protein
MILFSDGLCAQVLFNGQWVVGTTFYSSIVSDDHAFLSFHQANTRDYASRGHCFTVVNLVRGQL